jgi:hypothetical protein
MMRIALSMLAFGAVVAGGTPVIADVGDQVAKLTPSDAQPGDWLGVSVALGGGRALVGAYRDDAPTVDSGSAYLFDASNGAELRRLVASDGSSSDGFGYSTALEADTALVGAWKDDPRGVDSGSVYLFNAATGQQLRKLVPNDGAAGDQFGFSAALKDGYALVGSRYDDVTGADSGSAYLFNATTGAQVRRLTPSDAAAGDQFGFSVAMDNGVALVGSYLSNARAADSGAAYLFDISTGQQLRKLTPSDGTLGDLFGYSVALDDGVALVSAILDTPNGHQSGSAYLFDVATGQQLGKLVPDDGGPEDFFGWSVALDDGVAMISAYWEDEYGVDAGAAYLFDVATRQQLLKITADDASAGAWFGNSVAMENGQAIIGALREGENGVDAGAAYLFQTGPDPGDFDGDGFVDYRDYDLWREQYGRTDGPDADGNGDGLVNAADYTVWRDAMAAGATAVPEPVSCALVMSLLVGRAGLQCRLSRKAT